MGPTPDIRQETLSLITEWDNFLTFLDGFSLDKEIDDEAMKIKEKTERLKNLLGVESDATKTDADGASDDIYDDTMDVPGDDTKETTSIEPTASDTYEIEDFDAKKTAGKSMKSKQQKKQVTPDSKDDESQSSGGSLKDMADTIPVKTWEIVQEKDCPISGRLTKRSSPTSGGFFKSNPKVFAAIYQGVFYYFDKQTSKKQKGAFHIAGYTASVYVSDKQKKQKHKDFIFQMEAEGKQTYYFSTQTEQPMQKWVDMFNRLAKDAKEAESDKTEITTSQEGGAISEDLYELEPNPDNKDAIEEAIEDEDIYTDAVDVDNEDKIQDVTTPSPPPQRRDLPNDATHAPSPPLPRRDTPGSVTLRDKPAPLPTARQESENYDDGTSALPSPPKSWIQDEDDQEVYDDGTSAVPTKEPEKEEEKKQPPKYETFFYGLWDCKKSTENELEFNHGDMIEVIDRRYDNEGWWVGHLKGKVGLVPKNFLTPAYRKI